jgi:hypothetical protein
MLLFAHVFWQVTRLNHARLLSEKFIIAEPKIADKALFQVSPYLLFFGSVYGVLLWRFYMLLGDLGAWGVGAVILTSLIGMIAGYCLFLSLLMVEIKAIGIKIGMQQ